MSINLTTALQNVGGRDPNYVDSGPVGGPPGASRQTGLLLLDSDTVTFTAGPPGVYDTITATAEGGSPPSGAENLVYATPNGTSGTATLRALVPGDLPLATNASAGVVEPDNTTITISGGVISAVGGMTLIQKITATAESSITFSAIPQTFNNLKLVCSFNITSGTQLVITLNGVSIDYGWSYIQYSSNGGGGGGANFGQVSGIIAPIPAGSAIIDFPSYTSSVPYITAIGNYGAYGANVIAGTSMVSNSILLDVTSITLQDIGGSALFVVGSTFTLYGY